MPYKNFGSGISLSLNFKDSNRSELNAPIGFDKSLKFLLSFKSNSEDV